jgi:hypothetical protein
MNIDEAVTFLAKNKGTVRFIESDGGPRVSVSVRFDNQKWEVRTSIEQVNDVWSIRPIEAAIIHCTGQLEWRLNQLFCTNPLRPIDTSRLDHYMNQLKGSMDAPVLPASPGNEPSHPDRPNDETSG